MFADDGTGSVEKFRNVSVDLAGPRRVNRVLANGSTLVRGMTLASGTVRPKAHAPISAGTDVWGDNNPAINAKVAAADEVKRDGDVTAGFGAVVGAAARRCLPAGNGSPASPLGTTSYASRG